MHFALASIRFLPNALSSVWIALSADHNLVVAALVHRIIINTISSGEVFPEVALVINEAEILLVKAGKLVRVLWLVQIECLLEKARWGPRSLLAESQRKRLSAYDVIDFELAIEGRVEVNLIHWDWCLRGASSVVERRVENEWNDGRFGQQLERVVGRQNGRQRHHQFVDGHIELGRHHEALRGGEEGEGCEQTQHRVLRRE